MITQLARILDQRSRSLIIYPSATYSRYANYHVNYALRSSCLRFPTAMLLSRQRQNSRRNAVSKGKLKRPYSAKWTFLVEDDGGKKRERERRLISAHRLVSPSARENRPSDDPPRCTRTRTWDEPRSRTSSRVAPPVVRGRANRSSCPRDSVPSTVLSLGTRAPRQARETAGTRLPVNHAAQNPVVRGNPLRPGISRRPVIDGREPARWSRRYRPVSRAQKKRKKPALKLPRNLTFLSTQISGRSIVVQRFTGGDRPVEKGDV